MNHHRYAKTNSESVQTIVTKRHQIEYAVTAWTDGACEPNPGVGGWGFTFEHDGAPYEKFGGELETTNNRMELMAVIEAVEHAPKNRALIICTDSQLILLCAVGRWKRKTNVDLWRRLDSACSHRTVVYEWWRGHAGTEGNERADELAAMGRASVLMLG